MSHYVIKLPDEKYLAGIGDGTEGEDLIAVGDLDSSIQVFQTEGQAAYIAEILGGIAVPVRLQLI